MRDGLLLAAVAMAGCEGEGDRASPSPSETAVSAAGVWGGACVRPDAFDPGAMTVELDLALHHHENQILEGFGQLQIHHQDPEAAGDGWLATEVLPLVALGTYDHEIEELQLLMAGLEGGEVDPYLAFSVYGGIEADAMAATIHAPEALPELAEILGCTLSR